MSNCKEVDTLSSSSSACSTDCPCACGAVSHIECHPAKTDSQNSAWASSGFNYINPFVYKLQIDDTFYMAKIYMLTVLLLPFRVVGCLLSLVTAWFFACIALHGMTLDDLKEKPLTGWRKALQKACAFSMRLVYASGSFHYVKFIGERATPKEAPILVVAPHSSFVDSILVVVTGPPSIVAKQETSNIPLLGKIITCSQPIFVLREDPNSRHNTIKEIISRAKSKDDWPQVVIFTEGTCTNRTALIKFKPGAFYPGVPVQPVLLRYPDKYDTYTWTWDGPGVLKLLWLTLAKIYSRCEIEFLPVYTPNAEEKENAKLFADNVRAVMAKAMGVPTSDYSFEECIIMNRAKEMRIPFPGDIIEIERTLHELGLLKSDFDKNLVSQFCSLPSNGEVDFCTFANLLQIDANNLILRQLFTILDHGRCNKISMKSFLLCSFYCKIEDQPIIDFLRSIALLYTPTRQSITRQSFNKITRHCHKFTQQTSDALYVRIDQSNSGVISFDDFENYTKDNPKYEFLYKKQELIRRAWK